MKDINNNKNERVEVMALFGYEMTPCQPLTFKRNFGKEIEITDLLKTRIEFAGNVARHIFDILVGQTPYRLIFNSHDLTWHLTTA